MTRKKSNPPAKDSKHETRKPIGSEVMDLVPASPIKDVVCDFGEIALDATLDPSVMRDMPVIGTLVRVGGTVLTIRERIFIKKISRFLHSLEKVSNAERTRFIEKLNLDGMKIKVGEKIIMLLDRQEDIEKAALIGEAFSLYVAGKITLEKFESLSHAITLCQFGHLKFLKTAKVRSGRFMLPTELPHVIGSTFSALGVAETLISKSSATTSGVKQSYKLSEIGELLTFVFQRWETESTD